MITVNLQQLTKRFDPGLPDAAVHDLTLPIPAGQITVLLGPSGCGKTTTLKMIAGLLAPTAGDVTFDGRSVLEVPAEQRGAVMVFQNRLLFPFMNVGDNIGFGLKIRGVDSATIRRRVREMLERLHLPDIAQRRPQELSGGQQQRVALARALIVEPQVLLLDEPLANLDAHLRDDMQRLIRELQQQLEITTILVTHDQEEAVIMGDQIAVLFDGHLHQRGAPQDLYRRPADLRTARFFGGVNFVPGIRRGAGVETALGRLPVTGECPQPDGPCVVTVRPERLTLNGNTGGLAGRLVEARFRGTHAHFAVQVGACCFHVRERADQMSKYHVGAPVHVRLPEDGVWLLPPEEEKTNA